MLSPTDLPDQLAQTEVPEQFACQNGDYWCGRVLDWTGSEWLAGAANWLVAKPLHIIGLIALAVAIRWVAHKLIDRLSKRAAEGSVPGVIQRGKTRQSILESSRIASERRHQRATTMASLLKSIVTGVVFTIIMIMVIDVLGYNVAPLIASAGIVGVALGFGAQSLVKDFISGIFMILEDQYGVGDVVDVGEAVGEIEAVGLRITRLRDIDGTVWYVRNGEILRVGNMSQNWARTVLDIRVAYGENLDRVRDLLREEAHQLWDDPEHRGLILEEPEVWGVQSLDPESVLMRVVLKTAPLEQWGVARTMRERIKERFDTEGIEMPLPQRVLWNRDASTSPPEQSDIVR
ncbi:MAG TPA: mechanosensitive ion channel family protein [Nocardioidaceae bacterium]|nr:mechanosensitive ion channel family protein [Nocardioidaceae bacterium]